jgi:hypothetical protein
MALLCCLQEVTWRLLCNLHDGTLLHLLLKFSTKCAAAVLRAGGDAHAVLARRYRVPMRNLHTHHTIPC